MIQQNLLLSHSNNHKIIHHKPLTVVLNCFDWCEKSYMFKSHTYKPCLQNTIYISNGIFLNFIVSPPLYMTEEFHQLTQLFSLGNLTCTTDACLPYSFTWLAHLPLQDDYLCHWCGLEQPRCLYPVGSCMFQEQNHQYTKRDICMYLCR